MLKSKMHFAPQVLCNQYECVCETSFSLIQIACEKHDFTSSQGVAMTNNIIISALNIHISY